MSLKEQLKEDLKTAMRNKDTFKRDVIRLLNSSIKQIEVDERKDLSDEEVIKLIQKSVKQREDSIEQYQAAKRDDLVEKETQEKEILISYLPKQLDEKELEQEIQNLIQELGITSKKEMGKIMGAATKKLAGKTDGKKINEVVKRLLP
ncbi:MAG: GatB/YqeY domain-containing protein [Spirochaetota bacterium]